MNFFKTYKVLLSIILILILVLVLIFITSDFWIKKTISFYKKHLTIELIETASKLPQGIEKNTFLMFGYYKNGEFNKVINVGKELINKNIENNKLKNTIFFMLGFAYNKEGDWEKALETANKLQTMDSASAYCLKGIIYFKTDAQLAKKYFDDALKEDKISNSLSENVKNKILRMLSNPENY